MPFSTLGRGPVYPSMLFQVVVHCSCLVRSLSCVVDTAVKVWVACAAAILTKTSSLALGFEEAEDVVLADLKQLVSHFPGFNWQSDHVPGPLTLRMIDRVWSSMNSTRTCVTPPREPCPPLAVVAPRLEAWSHHTSPAQDSGHLHQLDGLLGGIHGIGKCTGC
jgi:hypothetical protein